MMSGIVERGIKTLHTEARTRAKAYLELNCIYAHVVQFLSLFSASSEFCAAPKRD